MSTCQDLIASRRYIEHWSVDECAAFVEQAGYPQYKPTFKFNKVTGADLFLLEMRHLPNLGIRNFVEQKSIMKFLRELHQQEDDLKSSDFMRQVEQKKAMEQKETTAEWKNEEVDTKTETYTEEESTDKSANISTVKFDSLEQKIKLIQSSPEKLADLWSTIDMNGNGKVSLAEIDRLVVQNFPILNNKGALMRAYKYTTLQEGDRDAWVEKKEFSSLLKNLFFFNKLWSIFALLDTGADRRMNIIEFSQGLQLLGLQLNKTDTTSVFNDIDRNGGGQILFDEFCDWVIQNQWDVD